MSNQVTKRYAAMHRRVASNFAGTGVPGLYIRDKADREKGVAQHEAAAAAWDAAKSGKDASAAELSLKAGIII